MTPEIKLLVQQSWLKRVPTADTAGQLFYANLFGADPSLKSLFKGEMEQQAQKLTSMITAAVAKLDDLETLVPILQSLGRRHVGYGVKPVHYATVGAALLQTLEQALGDSFTDATRQAWVTVYDVMADVMLVAGQDASVQAARAVP